MNDQHIQIELLSPQIFSASFCEKCFGTYMQICITSDMAVAPLNSLPIKMTPFSKKVLELIQKIPKGQVATYGQIAALAGKPHGARGVGWILNSCTKSHKLPWQRVINSKGKISFDKFSVEYRDQKRGLLKEKVKFLEDGSIDLKLYGWKKKAKKTLW